VRRANKVAMGGETTDLNRPLPFHFASFAGAIFRGRGTKTSLSFNQLVGLH
jgi:hypothetical protein